MYLTRHYHGYNIHETRAGSLETGPIQRVIGYVAADDHGTVVIHFEDPVSLEFDELRDLLYEIANTNIAEAHPVTMERTSNP